MAELNVKFIDDYLKTHKKPSSVFSVPLLLERIQRERELRTPWIP